MPEITEIQLGIPGPSGAGISAAQWAALQAIVASATTGLVAITVTDTGALLIKKADGTILAQFNTNGMVASIQNGGSLVGFSDAGSTERFRLRGNNGHIETSGVAPSVAVAAGGAAGASASLGAVTGDDTSGRVALTTGTGTTAGALIDVTFASAYLVAPSGIDILPMSVNAGGRGFYVTSISTTGFTIACTTALAASAAATIGWMVIG